MKRYFYAGLAFLGLSLSTVKAQTISGFENIITTKDSTYNGVNEERGFVSGAGHFWNSFNSSWGSWSGFSFSSVNDTSTKGWANQYASFPGAGVNNSLSYAVAYNYAKISFTESLNGDSILGISIANATYTYLSMRDGDAFAKKFGGSTGNDSDWFYVEFSGFVNGVKTGSVKHYLADFRDTNHSNDFIQKDWKWVNLSSLGKIHELVLTFASSDVDTVWGGFKTPAYACVDSLVYLNSSSFFKPIAEHDLLFSFKDGVNNEFSILANDKDPDGNLDGSNVTLIGNLNQANTQILTNGNVKITPTVNAYGWDSLLYEISDIHNLKDTAQLKLLFNDAPVLNNDSFALVLNSTVDTLLNVLLNDDDENKAVLKLNITKPPILGSATVVNNRIKYTLPQAPGIDTIKYTVTDEFGLVDSANVYISLFTSINVAEQKQNSELILYPNPTQDIINFTTNIEYKSVEVLNLNGQILFSQKLDNQSFVDVSVLKSGLYYIQFTSKKHRVAKSIIVK